MTLDDTDPRRPPVARPPTRGMADPGTSPPPDPRPTGVVDPDGLREKVAFLSSPDAYPERPDGVTPIETHMAWVFLAGDRAYKLKKPVRYRFLDFSTLERREKVCREEVRLNRRLAADVYLGTIPLTRGADGDLSLGGPGTPVEWLVVMRRLDRARMLDRAIVAGRPLDGRELGPAARLLAGFFSTARAEPLEAATYLARLAAEIDEGRRELLRFREHVRPSRVEALAGSLDHFLERHGAILEGRARHGRIVEGHGDLRPEHVFLGPPPAVIDCLEFDREFRILDPLDELAYLGVECERLGRPDVGPRFLQAYLERSGDAAPPALVAFHAARRGLVRAKIAIWHLDDGEPEGESWGARARDYLEVADRHAARLPDGR